MPTPNAKRRIFGPPPPPPPRRKSFFFRGLVILLPAALTVFLLATVVSFAQEYVTGPINSMIYWSLEGNPVGWRVLRMLSIDPYHQDFLNVDAMPSDLTQVLEETSLSSAEFQVALAQRRAARQSFLRDLDDIYVDAEKLRRSVRRAVHPLIGVLVSLLLVIGLGYLASGYLGRRLVSRVDQTMHHVPVVRSIYPYAKQVVEFFLSENDFDLGAVVAAPYPTEGLWSIGFVTSSGLRSVHDKVGTKLVSVYIASSPLPMTGYTIFVELERLIPLDITVDEALRTIVSLGVLIPPQERVEGLEEEMHRFLGRKSPASAAAAPEA